MSDKDYTGKKGADGDDYKPLQFYKDRITGVQNGFETFSEGDEHYFTYNIDGEVVLISEGYTSPKGRDNGIASVEKNRLIEGRYKRDVYGNDKHFFNLIAGNYQEIATSAWFTSPAAMEVAIARLMGNGSEPLAASSIVGNKATAEAPVTPQALHSRSPIHEEDDEDKGCCWLWWLLPILIALFVWFLFAQCCEPGKEEPAAVTAAASVAPAMEVSEPEPVNEVAPQVEETNGLGRFLASALPGGVELNIPEFGVENKLLEFIQDDSQALDKNKWFDFDRIYFDSGKAELKTDSREQIANIAQILRAYPDVKLKVGGYTDNTGSEAFNQTLSEKRAETVKNALISQGVAQDSIVSEGYGSQYPIASNDTEEGRTKNRRIALRVTDK